MKYSTVSAHLTIWVLLMLGLLTACGSDDAVRPDEARETPENGGEPAPGNSLADVLSAEMFSRMFLHQGDSACNASAFTYESLIEAARMYPDFGTTGSSDVRRREVAAFLANVSHETTGGWEGAPDGQFAWGLCFREELACEETPSSCAETYCQSTSTDYPCASGQSYHGRGPLQLSWNYNYGPVGEALGEPLLEEPFRVAENGTIGWKTALWFWMTTQLPKPSCHDVMTEVWEPSAEDADAGRYPGFGLTVNIINGRQECGAARAGDYRVEDRIGFYRRYTEMMEVSPGDNLTCDSMVEY